MHNVSVMEIYQIKKLHSKNANPNKIYNTNTLQCKSITVQKKFKDNYTSELKARAESSSSSSSSGLSFSNFVDQHRALRAPFWIGCQARHARLCEHDNGIDCSCVCVCVCVQLVVCYASAVGASVRQRAPRSLCALLRLTDLPHDEVALVAAILDRLVRLQHDAVLHVAVACWLGEWGCDRRQDRLIELSVQMR